MPLRGPTSSGGGISGLTANTVPYANSSTSLADTSVTKTEIEYVHGVTSAIQTQFGTKAGFPVATTSTLGANVDITLQTFANVTTAAITTSRNNEVVQIAFTGLTFDQGGSAHTIILGYNVDAGSDVELMYHTMPTSFYGNAAFGPFPVTIASAGAHTLVLRGRNLESSKTTRIQTGSVFSAIQY